MRLASLDITLQKKVLLKNMIRQLMLFGCLYIIFRCPQFTLTHIENENTLERVQILFMDLCVDEFTQHVCKRFYINVILKAS